MNKIASFIVFNFNMMFFRLLFFILLFPFDTDAEVTHGLASRSSKLPKALLEYPKSTISLYDQAENFRSNTDGEKWSKSNKTTKKGSWNAVKKAYKGTKYVFGAIKDFVLILMTILSTGISAATFTYTLYKFIRAFKYPEELDEDFNKPIDFKALLKDNGHPQWKDDSAELLFSNYLKENWVTLVGIIIAVNLIILLMVKLNKQDDKQQQLQQQFFGTRKNSRKRKKRKLSKSN